MQSPSISEPAVAIAKQEKNATGPGTKNEAPSTAKDGLEPPVAKVPVKAEDPLNVAKGIETEEV